MAQGLLHLHNNLRWVILLFLLITLVQAISKNQGIRKTSLFLLIAAHTTLIIGLYQVYRLWQTLPEGVELMKSKPYRFFLVEHPLSMIIAVVLITIARRKAKALNYKAVSWLLIIALLLIMVAVPWPFREGVARPLFPGAN